MIAEVFLAIAIILQAAAAALAMSLIRITGKALAWVLISVALCLMALRRIVPFVMAVAWQTVSPDPTYELLGMVLSGFMLAGVFSIKPIFMRIFESERRLAESERRFRGYFELPIVGFATVTEDRLWMTVNDRLCEMLSADRSDLVGSAVDERTASMDREPEAMLASEAIAGGSEGYLIDKRLFRGKSADEIWVSQAARYVPGRGSEPGYFVLIIQDISERKAYESRLSGSLKEKDALLRELYHRTKNNMQVICSLLHLELAKCKDPWMAEEFHTIEGRILSMSLVHEKLYMSRDLYRIDLADYVGDLVRLLMSGYGASPDRIRVSMRLTETRVPIDIAVYCGLILHEIVSNSLKHAFAGGREGSLDLSLGTVEGKLARIRVCDDGAGMPPDFDFAKSVGMGMKTAFALARQIDGNLSFETGHGVACELEFPLAPSDGPEAEARDSEARSEGAFGAFEK
jgi:PAS domain S-box-containing protein